MNIGQKINILFERSGYKNYADWGKAMGLPGDWLLEIKKKNNIEMINIKRLIKIAEYNQVTIDWLLDNNDNNYIVDMVNDLADNDICKMFDQIQTELQKDEVKFNGFIMSKDCKNIIFDAVDVLKGLTKSNL